VQEKLKPGDVLSFVESKEKVHIVFLLDSSGSISADDWALMQHGMNAVCFIIQPIFFLRVWFI
jgi:hypothetical protein